MPSSSTSEPSPSVISDSMKLDSDSPTRGDEAYCDGLAGGEGAERGEIGARGDTLAKLDQLKPHKSALKQNY